jgi:cation diffusion facilitator family transporter
MRPNPTPTTLSTPARSRDVRRVLAVVLVINIAIVALKLYVEWRTAALTVLGSALESGFDLLNNALGITLVAIAGRAPDEDHPYGHEKFESLGTLAIVAFLAITCFELLREGVEQLIHRIEPHTPHPLAFALLGATAVMKGLVVWYERRRGRTLGSTFLLADAAHTRGDLYITLLAIASLALARIGLGVVDAPLAIVVALIIARNGYGILKQSVPVLVDERAVDAAQIERLVRAIPQVADVRNVRSRSTASGALFAELTIGVPASATVADAHAIADAAEQRIRDALGAAEVTIHVEPA